METKRLAPFANQKYLNLETYRKTGQPVSTPVWFAEQNGVLYIYSLANAGKIKRIRNNPHVRVAPCDFRGKLKGEPVDAEAVILDSAGAERGHTLLNQKYGWMKKAGDFFSRLRGRERAVVAIHVS